MSYLNKGLPHLGLCALYPEEHVKSVKQALLDNCVSCGHDLQQGEALLEYGPNTAVLILEMRGNVEVIPKIISSVKLGSEISQR